MKTTVSVIRKDNPAWTNFVTEVYRLGKSKVYARAGVINEPAKQEHGDSNISTGMLATILEYGNEHIPARSFVKGTFRKNIKEYRGALRSVPFAMLDEQSLPETLDLIGAKMAQDMKAAIFNGVGLPPPNALSTIARKGFDHPLLETTQLMEAIGHDVRSGVGDKRIL